MCRSVECTLGKIWLGKEVKRKKTWGIHWWSVVKNPPFNQGCKFNPWLGNSDPTCYRAAEPRHCNLRACALRLRRSLCAAQPPLFLKERKKTLYLGLNILQSVLRWLSYCQTSVWETITYHLKNNYKDLVKTWKSLWKHRMHATHSQMSCVCVHTHTHRKEVSTAKLR